MTPGGFTDQPELDDLAPRARPIAFLALVLLALFVLPALVGCQSYPVAEEALRTGISANVGHAKDDALPAEARAVAEDNGDVMWKVLFAIGGCEEADIPAEVRARQAERDR